jgi:uncharacterized protein (TIGR02266 family)
MFAHSREFLIAMNRRHLRVPARARCWCETEDITIYARVLNVSEGGLCIRTYAPLSAGSRAKVRFPLESGGEVTADAQVVWAREERSEAFLPGMGLQFLGIDDSSVTALRQFVQRADPS